jgi:hypothetical protein
MQSTMKNIGGAPACPIHMLAAIHRLVPVNEDMHNWIFHLLWQPLLNTGLLLLLLLRFLFPFPFILHFSLSFLLKYPVQRLFLFGKERPSYPDIFVACYTLLTTQL